MPYSVPDLSENMKLKLAHMEFSCSPSHDTGSLLSPSHTKYDYTLKVGDERFSATYQSTGDTPSMREVLVSVIHDIHAYENTRCLDTFLEDCAYLDAYIDGDRDAVRNGIAAYENCKRAHDELVQYGRSIIFSFNDNLDALVEHLEALTDEEFAEEVEQWQLDYNLDRPELPEGWRTIEDLQAEFVDTVHDYGQEIVGHADDFSDAATGLADATADIYNADLAKWLADGNEGWVEQAVQEGLVNTDNFDFWRAVQAGQFEASLDEIYENREEITHYAMLEHLKDEGAYAIQSDVADKIAELDFDCDVFSDLIYDVDEIVEGGGVATRSEAREGIFNEWRDPDALDEIAPAQPEHAEVVEHDFLPQTKTDITGEEYVAADHTAEQGGHTIEATERRSPSLQQAIKAEQHLGGATEKNDRNRAENVK